jgi:hypothetical protein
VDYHRVRGNGSEETQRVKELFDRAPKDFHGVLSYGPNDEEDLKVLDKFIEEMNTEENRAEFLWIFQIVQEEVDRKLLKYLKTSPEPPSSSLPAAEASASSDDSAAALKPTPNVPVSKKSGSKDKPLTKEEKKLIERGGDGKRKHVIMSVWRTNLSKRLEAGRQKVSGLQTQVQAKESQYSKLKDMAESLKQTPELSRNTRGLSAQSTPANKTPAAKKAKKAKPTAPEEGEGDGASESELDPRIKSLEDRRDAAEKELRELKQELHKSKEKLEHDEKAGELTEEELKI